MRRVLILSSLSVALGLLMWGVRGDSSPALVASEPGCKPEAPILVTLAAPDDATGLVRADFSLRPVLELSELSWRWELSQDVRLVDGEPSGTAVARRGELTAGEALLQVPSDGRHHTARLVVTGLLRTGAADDADADDADADAADADDADAAVEPEPVTVLRTLSWGQPAPLTPLVFSPDRDTGTLVRVAAVPTTHTPAPATAGGR